MTTELTNCNAVAIAEPWFITLIDECKDIIVETEFTSRWSLVEGYHSLGQRILVEYDNFQRLRMPDNQLIATIANSLNKKPRTIYYAVQFARKYPDLNLLQEGKNVSWHHIINKYLTDGKEKPVKLTPAAQIKAIKELLQTEWMKANQEELSVAPHMATRYIFKEKCEFIRYLQDQVDKITEGLEL